LSETEAPVAAGSAADNRTCCIEFDAAKPRPHNIIATAVAR